MRGDRRNIWATIAIFLLLLAKMEGFGQPAVLYTSLSNTTPSSLNNRWPLNTVGAFRQYRFQANETVYSYWAFSLGTPAAPDYSISWRPYTTGNLMSYNTFIPVGWANGARYNTANGGSDGELNILNNYYYTFNVSPNAAADNVMAVLETSYNPKTMVLTDAPAPYGSRTATVTLSSAPSAGENVYIRYTTDNYVSSSIIQVTFIGAVGTALVPVPSTNGVTQQFYAYSSPKTKAEIDAAVASNGQLAHDMLTLQLSNGFSNTFTNQVVVTSTGGSKLMNTYATLKDAFDAINGGVNHSGTITIALIGNTTETATATLNASGTGAGPSFYTTLGIQPAGGAARTISGNLATPLISLNGADNVTIDGSYAGTPQFLLIRNTNAAPASTGTSIFLTNGATSCTITNCDIENNGTTTTLGNIVILTGINSVTISNNNIHDATGGIVGKPANAIYSGTATNTISINNNNIYNWTARGINAFNLENGVIITGNSFYMTGLPATSTQQISIDILGAKNNHTISNNFIGGQLPNCGGLPWTNSANVTFKGMRLSVGTTTAASVQGNTIQNISLTSPTSPGGAIFMGIQVTAGLVNIGTTTGNVVGHATTANSIEIEGTNTGTASSLIDVSATSAGSRVENNTLANFTYKGTANISMYGIRLNGNARKNKIYNIGSSTSPTAPFFIGIGIVGATGGEVSNNFIALSGGSATNCAIYGIYDQTATDALYNVYYNSISISGVATGTSSTSSFYREATSTTTYVLKNNILVNTRTGGGAIRNKRPPIWWLGIRL